MSEVEMLRTQVEETGEELYIPDVEPTESAKLFWEISDHIWQQKPEGRGLNVFEIPAVIPASDARDVLNQSLREVHRRRLVVSGISKAMKLKDLMGNKMKISSEVLDNPTDCSVGTYNWDHRDNTRFIDVNGEEQLVKFTDGHRDRDRRLELRFRYLDEDNNHFSTLYSISRTQLDQDCRWTSLFLSITHPAACEIEERDVKRTFLSTKKEIRILQAFQAIGGITLEDSPPYRAFNRAETGQRDNIVR